MGLVKQNSESIRIGRSIIIVNSKNDLIERLDLLIRIRVAGNNNEQIVIDIYSILEFLLRYDLITKEVYNNIFEDYDIFYDINTISLPWIIIVENKFDNIKVLLDDLLKDPKIDKNKYTLDIHSIMDFLLKYNQITKETYKFIINEYNI